MQYEELQGLLQEQHWYDIAWIVIEHVQTKTVISIPSQGVIFPTNYVIKSKRTNFKKTAGEFMAVDGLVANQKDPHASLCKKKRSKILQEAVCTAFVQLQKKLQR